MQGIRGKNVIYTGAAGLIGMTATRSLARNGANLILIDPNVEGLTSLRDVIASESPESKILIFASDVTTDSDRIEQVLEATVRDFGRIDCLVNSAYPRTPDWHLDFLEIPFASWRTNVDQHMNGYFLLSQLCAKRMVFQKQGNIVFFSSIYGLVGPDFSVYEDVDGMTMPAGYAAIKGGISNLTRYLAAYLGPHGIRVNAICPGGVENGQHPAFLEAYSRRVPMRRLATTEDIVGPLLFLISDASRYVTGVNLAVDGGWTAI